MMDINSAWLMANIQYANCHCCYCCWSHFIGEKAWDQQHLPKSTQLVCDRARTQICVSVVRYRSQNWIECGPSQRRELSFCLLPQTPQLSKHPELSATAQHGWSRTRAGTHQYLLPSSIIAGALQPDTWALSSGLRCKAEFSPALLVTRPIPTILTSH